MHLAPLRLGLSVVIYLSLIVPTSADPITAGVLEMSGLSGHLTLTGANGFSFDGSVDTSSGRFGPSNSCPFCPPNQISLVANWSGLGFSGATATYDGRTFESVGGVAPRSANFEARFDGSTPPPPVIGTSATVTAPFSFMGLFTYDPDPGAPEQTRFATVGFEGSGMATIMLVRTEGIDTWSYRSARYQFNGTDPVPEPATMLLLGTGLAFSAARVRRRGR